MYIREIITKLVLVNLFINSYSFSHAREKPVFVESNLGLISQYKVGVQEKLFYEKYNFSANDGLENRLFKTSDIVVTGVFSFSSEDDLKRFKGILNNTNRIKPEPVEINFTISYTHKGHVVGNVIKFEFYESELSIPGKGISVSASREQRSRVLTKKIASMESRLTKKELKGSEISLLERELEALRNERDIINIPRFGGSWTVLNFEGIVLDQECTIGANIADSEYYKLNIFQLYCGFESLMSTALERISD